MPYYSTPDVNTPMIIGAIAIVISVLQFFVILHNVSQQAKKEKLGELLSRGKIDNKTYAKEMEKLN